MVEPAAVERETRKLLAAGSILLVAGIAVALYGVATPVCVAWSLGAACFPNWVVIVLGVVFAATGALALLLAR